MRRISFKLIPEFEGRYRIYSDGRVWSSLTERFLKSALDGSGYPFVNLSIKNHPKVCKIHRLVAQAFCYNNDTEHKTCVNHKDEDKTNNNFWNLEWCTYSYNNNYGTRNARESVTKKAKGIVAHNRNVDSLNLGVSRFEDSKEYHRRKNKVRNSRLFTNGVLVVKWYILDTWLRNKVKSHSVERREDWQFTGEFDFGNIEGWELNINFNNVKG